MKTISRYVVREHVGPFLFALTALTSLMLLNFISRQFGELVGKGLPAKVIGHFFLLSIPFTIALTVPMSVLVAVLYAFSRLASENEVTAMKANGVSPWRLVMPSIGSGVVMSILLLAFNDQALPRANHELKTLQEDIAQTKPSLFLKDQVLNAIAEGKFYLKAGKVDKASGRMKEVVIYNLADPARRRTIYADSGTIEFSRNMIDLDLNLFHGQMQEVATDKPSQLDRLFFDQDRIRIQNVGSVFSQSASDSTSKGDREMSVCEMQKRLWLAEDQYGRELDEYKDALSTSNAAIHFKPSTHKLSAEPHGLGWAYCRMLQAVSGVREAHAATVDGARLHPWVASSPDAQDTIPKAKADTTTKAPAKDTSTASVPAAAAVPTPPAPSALPAAATATPVVVQKVQPDTAAMTQQLIAARAAYEMMHPSAVPAPSPSPAVGTAPPEVAVSSRRAETKMRVEIAQRARDRYEIEINKKFSLAAACLIFCIVAPPIALRFRGGVGLVMMVSLVVFTLYYVGLIGGEAAANKGLVSPFWAMWGTNVLLTLVGVVMLLGMGRDFGAGRGGGLRDWLDERRFLRDEKRAASAVARGGTA